MTVVWQPNAKNFFISNKIETTIFFYFEKLNWKREKLVYSLE